MMASSAVTTSRALTGALWTDCEDAVPFDRPTLVFGSEGLDGSVTSDEIGEPFMMVKAPDCAGISLSPASARMRSRAASSPDSRAAAICARTLSETRGARRISYVYEPSGSVAPTSRSLSEMLRVDANWWEY